jgi:hypothetical protein
MIHYQVQKVFYDKRKPGEITGFVVKSLLMVKFSYSLFCTVVLGIGCLVAFGQLDFGF